MKLKIILAALFLFSVTLFGGVAAYLLFAQPGSTPLENAGGGRAPQPLPKDAIVLAASDGVDIIAPFQLHDEAGAVGGVAAYMPKGSKKEGQKGKLVLHFQAADAGTYHAFVHGKWRDSCSNSCGLKVNDGTEITAGNDDAFSTWHWVSAGKHKVTAGANTATLIEREDGIYVDQILLTKESGYVPSGSISAAGVTREIRRFADTFSRSPGHGNDGWEFSGKAKFDIAFSFDPNRIPNQYALTGNASGGPGLATVKGSPANWYGCKMSFTFQPTTDGKYGCFTEQTGTDNGLWAGLEIKDGVASALLEGPGVSRQIQLGPQVVRLKQFHRIVVERWAWITRVWVDGNEVLFDYSCAPKAGKSGLFVGLGACVFDDFEIEEIPWQADNGSNLKLAWTLQDGAKWARKTGDNEGSLTGESGTIKAGLGGLALEELVLLEGAPQETPPTTKIKVAAPGLAEVGKVGTNLREFRAPANALIESTHAEFTAEKTGAEIQFVALRYGRRTPTVFNIGPYNFKEREIEDPSDYLDFTEAEYKEMARSPDAAKLQRQAKMKPVIGHGHDEGSSWIYMGGSWNVNTRVGCLNGRGRGAVLRHAQEIAGDMEMRFKIKLNDSTSAAEVELYSTVESGVRVQFVPTAPADAKAKTIIVPQNSAAMQVKIPADGKWHEVSLRVNGLKLSAKVGREDLQEATIRRGEGDRTLLKIIDGSVDFDDVEFIVQRVTEKGVHYGFNQPETHWWREPSENWVDHGGIACVLASSWISLIALDSEGMMWNKRKFSSDALVAFNVEENSEWYGWDKHPTHVHFPFDNITIVLAKDHGSATNYKLLVNAEDHSATLIFRNGKEVARVRQTRAFPMRYIGSHMPFMPRTNRISFIKRGGVLRGMVNGVQVIQYNDPDPQEVSTVGIGGHGTRMNISHVEIRELETETAPERKPDAVLPPKLINRFGNTVVP